MTGPGQFEARIPDNARPLFRTRVVNVSICAGGIRGGVPSLESSPACDVRANKIFPRTLKARSSKRTRILFKGGILV